jgi:hypothetical protein
MFSPIKCSLVVGDVLVVAGAGTEVAVLDDIFLAFILALTNKFVYLVQLMLV